jgi:NADH-quinone oxidoreductase subunit M
MGLPGLGNFIGEFLILVGTYQVSILLTSLAALGLIASTIYSLWMIQRAFHGPNPGNWQIPDLSRREMVWVGVLIVLIVWLGLFPQPVINTAAQGLDQMQRVVASPQLILSPNTGLIKGAEPGLLPVQPQSGWPAFTSPGGAYDNH